MIRSTIFMRALERVRDRIRGISPATGGYRDLRDVTILEGDRTSRRGVDEVEITIGPGEFTPVRFGPNETGESRFEFQVAIWIAGSERRPEDMDGPLKRLDWIMRDIWAEIARDDQLDGLVQRTELISGSFGGFSDEPSASLYTMTYAIVAQHDSRDPSQTYDLEPAASTVEAPEVLMDSEDF